MKVMAQIAMVMNLDKCIGCHTCSVTCKQTWTNRSGVEYVWFNNVESRPGQGYPRRYEDQKKWQGGWKVTKRGNLKLRAGGKFKKLATIFSNPKLPALDDYYEPWTYDYRTLTDAPLGDDVPVAQPISQITGQPMQVTRGANWDDALGGPVNQDVIVEKLGSQVKLEYEDTFLFYLPRICNHCLNPSCVASCPSGAMYKRSEDGIVLVDQDQCRGWRMCVTGCPYKKVYFNHTTGKAEKCTFCYPRIEIGLPTVCAETCVGRLRYLGILLYDADKVTAAASAKDPLAAQRDLILDPFDDLVAANAINGGIPQDWLEAARKSPVYKLVKQHQIALPLHPEYRTLPMVWYIPPLSPMVNALTQTGHNGESEGNLFGAIDSLRIPVDYLASLFSDGDPAPVKRSLQLLAGMRSYMAQINLGEPVARDPAIEELYRLLALAKYEERYVIPSAHAERAHQLEEAVCSVAGYEGGSQPFGSDSGRPVPVSIESFHLTKERQTRDTP